MSEKSEKSPEKVIFMSAIAEAQSLTRGLAEPRPVGDSVKAAVSRAYGKLLKAAKHLRDIERLPVADLSHNRVLDFWYGVERAKPRVDELIILDAAAKTTRQLQHQQKLEQAGRDELKELRGRVVRLEGLIRAAYPDIDSGSAAEVRGSLIGANRATGADHRSMDRE